MQSLDAQNHTNRHKARTAGRTATHRGHRGEVFTSEPELPPSPSTPTCGPDSPLALVSLRPGLDCYTGLRYSMRLVSREMDCQRSGYPPGTKDFNLTPTNTHLETEKRQNVWLKVKQDTAGRNRSMWWTEAPCLVAGARPAKRKSFPLGPE